MNERPNSVAFLRGINVGGHTARKDQLIAAVSSVGAQDVSTFLASGNVVFAAGDVVFAAGDAPTDPDELEQALSDALKAELGFTVAVFVRTAVRLRSIADRSPFPGLDTTVGTLQVGFLHRALTRPAKDRVTNLSSPIDHLAGVGRELYWHTAAGISDSPLFKGPALTGAIGQDVTMRNINTVRRLVDKLASR